MISALREISFAKCLKWNNLAYITLCVVAINKSNVEMQLSIKTKELQPLSEKYLMLAWIIGEVYVSVQRTFHQK